MNDKLMRAADRTLPLPIGLIECPYNMVAIFPRSEWYKKSKGEAIISFYYLATEVTFSFLQYLMGCTGQPYSLREGTPQRHESLRIIVGGFTFF